MNFLENLKLCNKNKKYADSGRCNKLWNIFYDNGIQNGTKIRIITKTNKQIQMCTDYPKQ